MVDRAPIEDNLTSPLDEDEDESSQVEAEPLKLVVPTVPGSDRCVWVVWLEVVVVIALTMPSYGGHSLAGWAITGIGLRGGTTNFYFPSILHCVFDAVIVFAAIWMSGDPWSAFGIKKPTVVDILEGSMVCVVSYGATRVGENIFVAILESMFSKGYVYQLTHTDRPPFHAHGWIGLAAILVLSIAVGFSEELVSRGYLIPRFERLLHHTWASVLLCAAIFGLLHWQSGLLSIVHAFLAGVVYGIAFAWTRSLWPVAFAHATYDFSALLSHAR